MRKRLHLAVLPACMAALLAAGASAGELNKCVNGSGAVTYTSETCAKEGLKDAGPIRERLTTMPSPPPPTVKLSPKKESAPEKKKEPAKDR